MYKKLNVLLDTRDKFTLKLLFLSSMIISILELLSIGVIPLYISALINPEKSIILLKKIEFFQSLTLNSVDLIFYSSLLLVILFVLKGLLILVLNFFELSAYKKICTKTSVSLFSIYFDLPLEKQLQKNTATIIRNLTYEINNFRGYISRIILIFKECTLLIFLFILLLVSNYLITLILIFFVLFVSVIFYLSIKRKAKKLGEDSLFLKTSIIKEINHTFGAFKTLRIFDLKNYAVQGFKNIKESIENNNLQNIFLKSLPRIYLEIIIVITIVLLLNLLSKLNYNLETLIPIITLYSLSLIRMFPIIINLNNAFTSIKLLKPSCNHLIGEIKKFKNFEKLNENIQNNYDDEFNLINFKNVHFEYELSKEKKIFNKLNIEIIKNSKIGIIGPSGSGKSTFINLLCGLLMPSSGEILINSKNIFHCKKWWQSKIGYVPQETFLMDTSIAENIAIGVSKDKIDLNKINTLLDFLKLSNFKQSLFQQVGERGLRISGGQMQRIGIARALYREPKVLILDEATSSLDIDTENKILNDVFSSKKNITIIIVSHRLSSLKNCDKIFDISVNKYIK